MHVLEIFKRTEMLIGNDNMKKLNKSSIAIFGVGGVGGYVAEALARCGVGKLTLVDNDVVSVTNINRQIIAAHETVGQLKTAVMKKRILSINPDANVQVYNCFFTPENSSKIDFKQFDYIVDAVDTVTAKIEIIKKAKEEGAPVISSMGTGNKLDPSKFQIADISKTTVCPLARVMRRELKMRNIKNVPVLYSTEQPIEVEPIGDTAGKNNVGSISFVPSTAGLLIAGYVINDIIKNI